MAQFLDMEAKHVSDAEEEDPEEKQPPKKKRKRGRDPGIHRLE